MNAKRQVYLFLSISAVLVAFLPVLNLTYTYLEEHRWQQEDFTKHRLFSTDRVEAMVNYAVYKTLGVSLVPSHVIAGKNGFFFLGNAHENVIDKTEGTYRYTQKAVEQWVNKLVRMQQWYEKQGIAFLFVIAPNKHTVYASYLPWWITIKKGHNLTDDIVRSANKRGVHLLDLRTVFDDYRGDKTLYFKTDTHWNHYGAYLGYKATIDTLNKIYHRQDSVPPVTLQPYLSKGGGDLTRFLKINRYMKTNNTEYDVTFRLVPYEKLCYGTIENNYTLTSCTPKPTRRFNFYTHNSHAPNKAKLLYMCDSFGLANSPLYIATYRTVWRLHAGFSYGKALGKFVRTQKPDIVIYQIVERNLGYDMLVSSLE